MNGKQIHYWDACIFIAWFTNDTNNSRTNNEMAGIKELVALIDNEQAILLTSSITRIEVLDCKLSNKTKEDFTKLFFRKNFQEKSVNKHVASLAHDIRNFFQTEREKGNKNAKKIKTPDAIHLATAILYKAEIFYTFDDDLIRFNGDVAGHNLTINKPQKEPFILISD